MKSRACIVRPGKERGSLDNRHVRSVWEAFLGRAVSRRDFFRLSSGAALALAAGGSLARPGLIGAAAFPDVAVVTGNAASATRAAVEMLGGMSSFVKKGDKVVIKPNMSFARGPESATNTSPEVVRELVAMCRAAGASRVRVLDHPLRPDDLCVKDIRDACRVFGDDMVHALEQGSFYREVSIPGAKSLHKTDVMKDVLEADVLISAPVAKSHGSTGVSLSLKGMMGLVYERGVMHYLHDLSTSVVDLASLLKPRLVVIDGSRVLSTRGPGGPGKVIRADTIIASKDMVAADAQAVSLFEWYGQRMEPRQVKHIRLAHERGLGRMDLGGLAIGKKSV
jgi:uncharacterized protein (DUF362 family)